MAKSKSEAVAKKTKNKTRKAPKKVAKLNVAKNKTSKVEKKQIGRPKVMTEAIQKEVLKRMMEGESVRSISRDPRMPVASTIFLFRLENKDFSEQYERAMDIRADFLADEIFDIADDASNDWMEKESKDGLPLGWELNRDHVQRSRIRIDTRKWYLSKIMPKKYGNKVDITSGDEKLNQPVVNIISYADVEVDDESDQSTL